MTLISVLKINKQSGGLFHVLLFGINVYRSILGHGVPVLVVLGGRISVWGVGGCVGGGGLNCV